MTNRQTFNTHPFHQSWDKLKENIEKIQSNKIVNTETIDNTARFKKVVVYIDNYLKIIDTDLITQNNITNLDSINKFIEHTYNEIIPFLEKDYLLENIIRANINIDEILKELKQFHIVIPKISRQSISSMLKQYNETIDQSLSEIDLESTKKNSQQIQSLKETLIDGKDEEESTKTKIENLLEDFEKKQKELAEFYNQTLSDSDENTTKKLIESSKKLIEEHKNKTDNVINELSNKIEEFNKFYVTVFGELAKDGKTRMGGLKNEIENRKSELEEFKKTQKEKYDTLNDQIENLLPGATSAGLAESYNKEREKFAKPVKNWNVMFIGNIVSMLIVTVIMFVPPISDVFKITTQNAFISFIVSLLYRLPFYAPLIWLGVYASIRRSQYQRLEQEYAHKETLAKSYINYQNQIEKLKKDKEELSSKLLDSSIDTLSKNPSKTLGKHSSNMPIKELFQLLKGLVPKNKTKE